MAKNPQPQSQPQPQPQEEDDEEEEEQYPLPKTHKHSHSDSDSDSDSDPEEDAPVLNIKPTTAKRRLAENETESEGKEPMAKKLKKKANAEVEMPSSSSSAAPKKHFFQRLWSEEDEIVILNGMTDYVVMKNAYPVANIGDFLDFIKKSLHVVDVTATQLKDKIRKLKKKYRNNATKGRTSFSKSHEQRVYELSKKLWGDENDEDDGAAETVLETPRVNTRSVVRKTRSNNPPKIVGQVSDDVQRLKTQRVAAGASVGCRLDYSGVEEWILNVGVNMVEADKRLEMEEKWKQLEHQEVEQFLNNLELIRDQTKLVLEAMKKGR